MSLTLVVVTADFATPDGQIPTGAVRFDLSGTLSDSADGLSVPAREVEATLDVLGRIAQPLAANGGAGVAPSSNYWVSERIVGAPERDYYATVPAVPPGGRALSDAVAVAGSPTLTSATGAFTSNDLTAFVYCAAFPFPARIATVVSGTAVTLSQRASVSGSGLSALVGASVDLASLRPL